MKKYNIFKLLTIGILVSIVLSYFIPGTAVNYGTVEKGMVNPVTFADTFTNGITAFSAFLSNFIYVLVIGIFYAVLHKTKKYESLVNNVAVIFNKNKGLFIVLTIFILGLSSLFTGEIYAMLIFVPFLISVINKLGYNNKVSIISTVGAIVLGNAGSLYTYYINQFLSLTANDNVLTKVIVAVALLVSLVAFVLVFNQKPESTKDLKKEEKAKVLPLHIIMWSLFVLLVLGFVNWAGLFKFNGFDTFLETLRKGEIAQISVFDALLGKSVVAFGTWQTYNAAVLVLFVTVLIALIYKVKVNELFESFASGLKKAFPYALIIILANIILVNIYSTGLFYTLTLGLTKKTVSIFTGSLTTVLASLFYPDYAYATQFTLTSVMNTTATGYESLFALLFQALYSIFLLVSPTSIILLLALRYKNVRYGEWIKYVYKYFLLVLVMVLVIISVMVKGFNAFGIIALILLVVAMAVIFWYKLTKLTVKNAIVESNKEIKANEKVEVNKVESKPAKKTTTKKTTTKKTATKKTNKK